MPNLGIELGEAANHYFNGADACDAIFVLNPESTYERLL